MWENLRISDLPIYLTRNARMESKIFLHCLTLGLPPLPAIPFLTISIPLCNSRIKVLWTKASNNLWYCFISKTDQEKHSCHHMVKVRWISTGWIFHPFEHRRKHSWETCQLSVGEKSRSTSKLWVWRVVYFTTAEMLQHVLFSIYWLNFILLLQMDVSHPWLDLTLAPIVLCEEE